MFRRSKTPEVVIALVASAALVLISPGCGSRVAPEEAPPLASVTLIPTAAPGATGVVFKEPGAAGSLRPASPDELWPEEAQPTPPPSLAPPPQPLPLDSAAPSPFGEPPPVEGPKKSSKPKGGGQASGKPSTEVQL